jgi:hypothetical protein
VEVVHRNFLCDLCLKNRHCVLSDLAVFETKAELNKHLHGEDEDSNVNHKRCVFCSTWVDDADALKRHYRDEHRICDFCSKTKKKEKDYVFDDYRAFMNHAKEKHHICGIGGCDCVFEDLTSLDMHQADIHKKKVSLRIGQQNYNDNRDSEDEEEKRPQVSTEQYKRWNDKTQKNQHFPTLSGQNKVYTRDEDEDESGNRNKRKRKNGIGSG